MQKNNQSDIFETNKTAYKKDNSNFFESEDFGISDSINLSVNKNSPRRLNDYDYNLLKEDAYRDVTDDLFKLEYKISKTETELKEINEKINSAKEIRDYKAIETLEETKKFITEEYENLLKIYNQQSLSAKISDGISNIVSKEVKQNINNVNGQFSKFLDKIISALPPKLKKIVEIKKSLAKLENINKSVDELVKLKIPYGENIDKYNQLSKYIIKANSIQAELRQYIKK